MAVNIGATAVNAVVELRGNRDFEQLLAGLGEFVQVQMQRSMDAPVERRVDQTAHARGMYDIWEGLFAAYNNLIPSQVKIPPPKRLRGDGAQVDNHV
jgi:hypothetical protein